MWSWWLGVHCAACAVRLAVAERGPWCASCAVAAEAGPPPFDLNGAPVYAGWVYGGAVVAAVARAKSGEPVDLAALARPLRARLAASDVAGQTPALVAVPPQRQRLVERGAHLPDMLATTLRDRRTPVVRALERLDLQAPRRTERGEPPVLRAVMAGRNRRALLIDDVVTSGATLQASATVLAQAGWTVIGAAVLADARPAVVAARAGVSA